MINLGPLTTVYDAPGDCNVAKIILGFPSNGATTFVGLYVGCVNPSGLPQSDPPGCYPSHRAFGAATSWESQAYLRYTGYFSPATQCPVNWSPATSGQDTSLFRDLKAQETGIMCCPKGLQHVTGYCSANVGFTTTVGLCDPVKLTVSAITTLSNFDTYNPQATTLQSGQRLGIAAIQLRYTSDSTPPPNTTPITSLTSQSAATRSSRSVSPSNTSSELGPIGDVGASSSADPADQISGSSLSTGAKAAIGVVIPVVVLALIGFGFILLRRRRRAAAHRPDINLATGEYEIRGSGLIVAGPESGTQHDGNKIELDTTNGAIPQSTPYQESSAPEHDPNVNFARYHEPWSTRNELHSDSAYAATPPIQVAAELGDTRHEVSHSPNHPFSTAGVSPNSNSSQHFTHEMPTVNEIHGVPASNNTAWSPNAYETHASDTASRTQTVYSDSTRVEHGDEDERARELTARIAAVRSQRDRLHRIDMLREEEERLERELQNMSKD